MKMLTKTAIFLLTIIALAHETLLGGAPVTIDSWSDLRTSGCSQMYQQLKLRSATEELIANSGNQLFRIVRSDGWGPAKAVTIVCDATGKYIDCTISIQDLTINGRVIHQSLSLDGAKVNAFLEKVKVCVKQAISRVVSEKRLSGDDLVILVFENLDKKVLNRIITVDLSLPHDLQENLENLFHQLDKYVHDSKQ